MAASGPQGVIDHTHHRDASTWVEGADDHADFPVQNLPLGAYSRAGEAPRIGTAIGDHVLDLQAIADLLPERLRGALQQPTLNTLFALPAADRLALRHALFALLTSLRCRVKVAPHLHPAGDCMMHLPFHIGDYSDFYVGIHHAGNVGALFRPDNPLLPNYKHVPIGYHGRASSIRVSGTPVVRPRGQINPDAGQPIHAPCRRLDYELELGVWIAGDNDLGDAVPIAQAGQRIGGLCLLNDWSARDMQAWEYQPLGPFLAKSFLSSVSPWVITAEALAPFRTAQPARPAGDPAPLPYLWDEADQARGAFSLDLEVLLSTAAMRERGMTPMRLSQGNSAPAMYWTVAQMVAHHTGNGCDLHAGDLLGTGTLSGPTQGSVGSLLERSQGGKTAVDLPSGESRCFLEDGDEVTLRATAHASGFRSIGFGPCTGRVEAARQAP
jgi:fumarylacetoacetase